jgi:hypothetical protein
MIAAPASASAAAAAQPRSGPLSGKASEAPVALSSSSTATPSAVPS